MPTTEQAVQICAIEGWLLSILRFAVTRDEPDRAAVLALAIEMDRGGSGFTFFARTSVAVCDAIVAKDRTEATAELRVFVRAIDHARLRRAFEAVFVIKALGADRRVISDRNREKLWKGLPSSSVRTAPWR